METIQKGLLKIAVISNIGVNLKTMVYINSSIVEEQIADNPFDPLKDKPQTYTDDGTNCDTDNEWTFVDGDPYITHQRNGQLKMEMGV